MPGTMGGLSPAPVPRQCPALHAVSRDGARNSNTQLSRNRHRRIVMNSSQLKIWACAASLVAASALSTQAQDPHSSNRSGISVIASTVPANGDVNPYGIVRVPRSSGSLGRRKHPDQQFQQQLELAGNWYNHRPDCSGRHHQSLRSDRRQQFAGSLPGWHWINHGSHRLAGRMGHRRAACPPPTAPRPPRRLAACSCSTTWETWPKHSMVHLSMALGT